MQIQVGKMRFLFMVAGFTLCGRVGSPVIWEDLGVETLRLCIERRQLYGRMPPGRRPSDRPRTCWWDYISQLAWTLQEKLGEFAEEKDICVALLPCCHHESDPDKWSDVRYMER